MKQTKQSKAILLFAIVLLIFTSLQLNAGEKHGNYLPPIVSTEWLLSNMDAPELVIVDIRETGEYEAGHIAGSINEPMIVPFSAWITMRDDLLLEVPDTEDLFAAIGALGITEDSSVVIITSGTAAPPYPLANATRVADTLIYAGVKNVTILDGGINQWIIEGKPLTMEIPEVVPVEYTGCVKENMFVSREYVEHKISKKWNRHFVLIDARDAEVYSGEVIEPFAALPGHIPTAKSLPTISLWTEDGKYKPVPELAAMAAEVVGPRAFTEIVVYCGVGGYASSMWYVLHEVLGYRNVKIYDGAAQEWVLYNNMETE